MVTQEFTGYRREKQLVGLAGEAAKGSRKKALLGGTEKTRSEGITITLCGSVPPLPRGF